MSTIVQPTAPHKKQESTVDRRRKSAAQIQTEDLRGDDRRRPAEDYITRRLQARP